MNRNLQNQGNACYRSDISARIHQILAIEFREKKNSRLIEENFFELSKRDDEEKYSKN